LNAAEGGRVTLAETAKARDDLWSDSSSFGITNNQSPRTINRHSPVHRASQQTFIDS
jgi:hypothetical protein